MIFCKKKATGLDCRSIRPGSSTSSLLEMLKSNLLRRQTLFFLFFFTNSTSTELVERWTIKLSHFFKNIIVNVNKSFWKCLSKMMCNDVIFFFFLSQCDNWFQLLTILFFFRYIFSMHHSGRAHFTHVKKVTFWIKAFGHVSSHLIGSNVYSPCKWESSQIRMISVGSKEYCPCNHG